MSYLPQNGFLHSHTTAKSRPQARVEIAHDDEDTGRKYRGAQCWSISDDVIVLRVMLSPHHAGDRVVDRALFDAAGFTPALGDAVACEVVGGGLDDMVVIAVAPGRFPAGGAPTGDQRQSVADGHFHPSGLNEVVPGVYDFQDGARGWSTEQRQDFVKKKAEDEEARRLRDARRSEEQ